MKPDVRFSLGIPLFHCSWKAGFSESNTENKLFWCYLLENVREMICLSLGMALSEGTGLVYRFRKGKPWPWQTNQEELLCGSPLMWIEPSYCSPLSACNLVSVAHKSLKIGAFESSLEAGFVEECSVDLEDWLGFFPSPPAGHSPPPFPEAVTIWSTVLNLLVYLSSIISHDIVDLTSGEEQDTEGPNWGEDWSPWWWSVQTVSWWNF